MSERLSYKKIANQLKRERDALSNAVAIFLAETPVDEEDQYRANLRRTLERVTESSIR